MMTRTRKYLNIRILSWPNIRIHFFPTNPSPTPKSPKGWHKNAISLFVPVKFNFYRNKSATKFLCVKTSRGKVVATSFTYPTVQIDCGRRPHLPEIGIQSDAPLQKTPMSKAFVFKIVLQPWQLARILSAIVWSCLSMYCHALCFWSQNCIRIWAIMKAPYAIRYVICNYRY